MDMDMELEIEMGMGMEEEEFFYDQFLGVEGDFVIDFDYEFDAPKFHDFTNPEKDLAEEQEADLWFESAQPHPPSPHVLRWKLRMENLREEENLSSFVPESENMNPNMAAAAAAAVIDDQNPECEGNVVKEKPRSGIQRCSSFMNPTVSHLAKQINCQNVQCDRLLRRLKKLTLKDEIMRGSSVNAPVITKRQKLESGFVGKVAHLKHQASFPHKSSRQVGQTTIPKEPNLETANRAAARRMSKNVLESGENAKSHTNNFKARPLNKKIFRSPSLNLHERRTPRNPQFQEFHLRTMERAKHHARISGENAANSTRTLQDEITDFKKGEKTVANLREKPEGKSRLSTRLSKQESSCAATNEKVSAEPPVEESLNKLTPSSEEEVHSAAVPQSEILPHSIDTEENPAGSFAVDYEVHELINVHQTMQPSELMC